MPTFIIKITRTGKVLGRYVGADEAEALKAAVHYLAGFPNAAPIEQGELSATMVFPTDEIVAALRLEGFNQYRAATLSHVPWLFHASCAAEVAGVGGAAADLAERIACDDDAAKAIATLIQAYLDRMGPLPRRDLDAAQSQIAYMVRMDRPAPGTQQRPIPRLNDEDGEPCS